MPDDDLPEIGALAVVSKPLPHDSARLHVTGAATYVDDMREPAGTLHIAPGLATRRARTPAQAGSRAGAQRAGCRHRAHRRRYSRPQRHLAGGRRRAGVCLRQCHLPRPAPVRGRGKDPRCRPPRRAPRRRRDRSGDADPQHRGCDRGGEQGAARLRLRPRRRGSCACWRTAPPRRAARDRRAGALLPRGPGRPRDPRRGGAADDRLLHAGSGRGAAHRGARAGHPRRHGDGRDAPHGRSLRRQGEPGVRVGGDSGARRPHYRPPLQAAARPRRGFRGDGQAARLPRRLADRLRRRRQACRLRRHAQRALRLQHGPVAGRRRPGHVPRRQRLLDAGRACRLATAQDQHGLQHGVPRLRRPAGDTGDRAGDGCGCPRHRARSARCAQGQPLCGGRAT